MIRVGLCTIAFRDLPIHSVVALARECGVDGLEIWGREPHICERFNSQRVQALARLVTSRGLEVGVFGSYVRLGVAEELGPDQLSSAETALLIAARLGAPLVRVWAGNCPSAQATSSQWQACLSDLQRMAEMAADRGLSLAIEMHGNTLADTGETTRRLLDQAGADNVLANYQPAFDPNLDEPFERLEAVLGRVANVHAQNMNYRTLDGETRLVRVPIAQGLVDYAEVARRLKAHGYQGYLEVEFLPEGELPKQQMLLQDVQYLRSIAG